MPILLILQATPTGVWLLLAALIGLGLWQTRTQVLAPARVVALPVGMLALSIYGVVGSFGANALPFAAFAASFAVAVGLGGRLLPAPEARWLADRRAYRVGGSGWPLTLILCVFAVKYAAGVGLAMQPARALDPTFAVPFSLAYGLFAGAFALRGWKIHTARRETPAKAASAAASVDGGRQCLS